MNYDNTARKNRSEGNKIKIMKEASRLISEKGFDNVSVSDITAAAGVSKGAFYIHFNSKTDLVEKIIRFTFDDIKKEAEGKDPFDAVSSFLIKSTEDIINTGLKMAQKWFSDALSSSDFGKKKLEYDLTAVKTLCEKALAAEEAEILSRKTVSVYYGALNLWCITDGEINPLPVIKNFIDNDLKILSEVKK